ncbi:hypothetical protein DESUT3_17640 [Desulfuromonas versatilis]|uniref:Uncharacterized protein n=1 Tax=Desulfuromonas versatilis TaxID=2802975 RepID=A0ABM8HUG5_9BACT|nr:hypothetical protein [Desulfuromonas versatilis]BCR04695.1 hypothetical protein DESUT3_17640 [Desulfuromonas versatilis]
MGWFSLVLSAEQVAKGEMEGRRNEFAAAFKAAGAPRMMALFREAGPEGGLTLYLTPDCGSHAPSLVGGWNCAPCEKPAMAGLELVVGFNEITYYLY